MRVQCSWCEADLGRKQPLDIVSVTYSICARCLEAALRDAGFSGSRPHQPTQAPKARRSPSTAELEHRA